MPRGEVRVRIAGIIMSVICDGYDWTFAEGDACAYFVVVGGKPEVVLRTHCGDIPEFNLGEKVFDSGSGWRLYRAGKKYILHLGFPTAGLPPSRLVVFGPDFRSCDIYIRAHGPDFSLNPLIYPLDEILMVNLLSLGRGVLLHAAGVSDDGRGVLFVGTSGAGKSTLASLWKSKKDAPILSDDRIVVRKVDGRFWIYGTPWHGDAKVSSPEGAPLEKIFFLKHAPENKVVKIKRVDAVSRLLVCSFPTLWDSQGMRFTLKFCDELSREVPCCELGFVPDEKVLDMFREVEGT